MNSVIKYSIVSESFTNVASKLFELLWYMSWILFFFKKCPPLNSSRSSSSTDRRTESTFLYSAHPACDASPKRSYLIIKVHDFLPLKFNGELREGQWVHWLYQGRAILGGIDCTLVGQNELKHKLKKMNMVTFWRWVFILYLYADKFKLIKYVSVFVFN